MISLLPFKKNKQTRFILFSQLTILVLLFNPAYGQQSTDQRRVADNYGQLRIEGPFVLNEHNDTVTLEGMSFFWSQWMGKYYNYDCVKWLRDDWHCDVVRAAIAVEHNGYIEKPEKELEKITTVINAAVDLGMYIIVDWHSHVAHIETDAAVGFFSEIARLYGNKPNIIYEIYNEPLQVSWDTIVKPYCEKVIAAIRQFDPDNIIIVGTPTWSQDVDIASRNPLSDKNIAYALHYYAGTHSQWLRDKADIAIENGLALWVSEFGTCNASGSGAIKYDELELWFRYLDKHKISWCNWSVADKKETASILKPRADKKGNWPNEKITESGLLIREKIRGRNP
jgi:endoglucanase